MHITAEGIVRKNGTLKKEQTARGWWNHFLQRQG